MKAFCDLCEREAIIRFFWNGEEYYLCPFHALEELERTGLEAFVTRGTEQEEVYRGF